MSEPRRPPARRRPWFGPSRRGWGLWPRAWQGWALTALGLAVVVVLVVLASR
ncbi:hypothetical protein ACXR2U_11190 [Jatrophihabitans sp. YIM 134969]